MHDHSCPNLRTDLQTFLRLVKTDYGHHPPQCRLYRTNLRALPTPGSCLGEHPTRSPLPQKFALVAVKKTGSGGLTSLFGCYCSASASASALHGCAGSSQPRGAGYP